MDVAAGLVHIYIASGLHAALDTVAGHIAPGVDIALHTVAGDAALGGYIAVHIIAAHVASGGHIAHHVVAGDAQRALDVQSRTLVAEVDIPDGVGTGADVPVACIEHHPQHPVIGPGQRRLRLRCLPAEKLVDGDAEQVCQLGQQGDVRATLARFP